MTSMSIALADTILERFPDPDTIPYRRWCYVQGYVLCGFEKLWRFTGDPRYFAYIKRFVDQHVSAEGDIQDFTGDSLDDIMAGTTIVAIYEHTREPRYQRAADTIRAAFHDYPRNRDGGFWHARLLPHEMWIDGVFMGLMFLTRYAAVIGEQEACYAEAAWQIIAFADRCRKGETGLFLHAYDESHSVSWADPTTGLSPEVWSEGLGWYALILAETLELLPSAHPSRPQLLEITRRLAAGLRQTQDHHSGLWFQVVDKGDRDDNWHDTSGSAMFVYFLQHMIDLGYLDAEQYRPSVERGYAGIVGKMAIGSDGLVDIYDACDGVCVQRSYADYIHYPRRINAKEALGSVLWATTIVEKPTNQCCLSPSGEPQS
jgi:unsaturated rhamnogalacturonyl hydrolase